ncbi:hypothetical protein F965_00077 [Acinetobacter schindleri NIPH 900]|uniref:Uncharacterized protein n=1 Tax=Acinetobacter schindleri NIPH 900 TaxID=1217675 RepID=N8WRW1_9GAMM|nr:hypothetical protein [Acinetobacter schindleri]ENV14731.1 hypothetical protein F965_00077 [Acinetobacter schindleri NIPH 900]
MDKTLLKLKVGMQVLHTKNGHVWTIKRIDANNKRCYLERRSGTNTFCLSAAYHFLISTKEHAHMKKSAGAKGVDDPKPAKAKKTPKITLKAPKETEKKTRGPQAGIKEMAKLISVLSYLAKFGPMTCKGINSAVLKTHHIRSVQRQMQTLIQEGYLKESYYDGAPHFEVLQIHKPWLLAYRKSICE